MIERRTTTNAAEAQAIPRRELLRAGCLALGGLTLADLFHNSARAEATTGKPAKHCIFVFLNGGPSQLHTFDMKPDAPAGIRGPYHPISTSVAGIQISENLPRLAALADRYSIVRSASHHLSAHNSSAAYALSGHSPGTDANISPTSNDHPTYGSVVARVLPPPAKMPPFVLAPTREPTAQNQRRRTDHRAVRIVVIGTRVAILREIIAHSYSVT
jgi:uncharacterized protein DUF1501